MFYEDTTHQTLRFGDIVRGYLSGTPTIDKPNIDLRKSTCTVKLNFPPYHAVMTPCCSIGEGMISLAPLISIKYNFLNNPYFAEDLTNINRQMSAQQAFAPSVWESWSDEMRQERQLEGRSYALVEFFIYERHPLLEEYSIGPRSNPLRTGYYMVDFRTIYQLECRQIQNPKNCPWDSKVLELTVSARNELRDKLSSYYQRRPKEDLIQIQ